MPAKKVKRGGFFSRIFREKPTNVHKIRYRMLKMAQAKGTLSSQEAKDLTRIEKMLQN